MRNNFQRISEIIREAVKVIKHEPSLDKFDAFKKALIKINKEREAKYLVKPTTIGHINHFIPTKCIFFYINIQHSIKWN